MDGLHAQNHKLCKIGKRIGLRVAHIIDVTYAYSTVHLI